MNPVWVEQAVVLPVHEEQLAEHGGAVGLRDPGLLDSALPHPKDLAAHGQPDIPALAACYAFGLARDRPFIDGNKRASAVVTELFLALNGYELAADDADILAAWRGLAAGTISEKQLAAWLRARSVVR